MQPQLSAKQTVQSPMAKRNVFIALEPNNQYFENEGKSHHMKYYIHSTVVVLCDGFHLPPWDFPYWNLQTV